MKVKWVAKCNNWISSEHLLKSSKRFKQSLKCTCKDLMNWKSKALLNLPPMLVCKWRKNKASLHENLSERKVKMSIFIQKRRWCIKSCVFQTLEPKSLHLSFSFPCAITFLPFGNMRPNTFRGENLIFYNADWTCLEVNKRLNNLSIFCSKLSCIVKLKASVV